MKVDVDDETGTQERHSKEQIFNLYSLDRTRTLELVYISH